MSYEDLAETAAFVAGREAARDMHGTGSDAGDRLLPADQTADAEAWLRGRRSWWS